MANEPDDFVDRVAQAVIDKIEERDKIASLVEQIAQRVIAIQEQEVALRKSAQAEPDGANINAVEPAE